MEESKVLFFVFHLRSTMEKILTIQKAVVFDESIAHYEVHAHQPYATSTFNNSDEIRIAVQHQDLCLLPSRSSLHIAGQLTKDDGISATATTSLVNMAICHLFEEIRYELNAVEIDRSKNVGLTSLMKGYPSLCPGQNYQLENAGWLLSDEDKLTDADGYFDVTIPLSLLLGFAEDYQKIIVNAKHELILTRANTDVNAVYQTADEPFKITLRKIDWLIPYIKVSDTQKIHLLNYIAKDPAISMAFRTWELFEFPLVPQTPNNVWAVKTSTQLEKPRFIILAFQTDRKNSKTKNISQFDHCQVRDVKVFLNSQAYPYGSLNLDIAHNQYALAYNMFTNFQTSYYDKEPEPLLNKANYLEHAPLIIIDCSKQSEALKSGPVDVRIEFEAVTQFPARTSAYCLVLHDRIVQYNPISGTVRKLV